MSVSPSIRLVAYPDRAGLFVFVAVPDERGRYMRTDRSVVLVDCPICKSIKGEPCRSKQGYTSGTHAMRRRKATIVKGQQDDVIDPVDPSAPEPTAPPPTSWPELDDMPEIHVEVRRKILGCVTLIEPRAIT